MRHQEKMDHLNLAMLKTTGIHVLWLLPQRTTTESNLATGHV